MFKQSFANVVQEVGSANSSLFTHQNKDVVLIEDVSGEKFVENSWQNDVNLLENNLHHLFLNNQDHPGLVLTAKKLVGTDK